MAFPSPTPLVAGLPPTVPFVAPEEIERRLGRPFLLRLGANESAFGPSPAAARAAAGFETSHYGDPKAFALRAALAARHDVAMDEIVVASGIDELLALFCRAFCPPGSTVVTSQGTYPTLEYAAQGFGAKIERVPYDEARPSLDALAARSRGSRLVYLANPDNPTGALLPAAEVERFRSSLPGDCLLLLDEAYADFVAPSDLPNFRPSDGGVVRLRTFSKAHGLAGLRIGYALAHKAHAAALDRIRLHFGVNGPAQAAALASLGDRKHLAEVVKATADGRSRLAQLGTDLGFRPLPSWTNFVLFEVGGPERAAALVDALAERRTFVRRSAAGGLRITVGRPEELDRLAPVLCETVEAVEPP